GGRLTWHLDRRRAIPPSCYPRWRRGTVLDGIRTVAVPGWDLRLGPDRDRGGDDRRRVGAKVAWTEVRVVLDDRQLIVRPPTLGPDEKRHLSCARHRGERDWRAADQHHGVRPLGQHLIQRRRPCHDRYVQPAGEHGRLADD